MLTPSACAQNTANKKGHCRDAAFDKEVQRTIALTVPAVDVDSLRNTRQKVTILDAREPAEFAVSHIPGAIHCGYDHFDLATLKNIPKNQRIVVYCSIGYRSEKVGDKLRKAGYTNVVNLYGSIFEWVNRGYPLVDAAGKPTFRIHTYNQAWGKWVTNKRYTKVTGD